MRWAFVVDITGLDTGAKVRDAVQKQSEEARSSGQPKDDSIFRVLINFYQRQDRWKAQNPQVPREDIGRDLDNLVKNVFDGLGPIIGWRQRYEKDQSGKGRLVPGGRRGVRDAQIVELVARKVNSGSNKELLSVEVETIVL